MLTLTSRVDPHLCNTTSRIYLPLPGWPGCPLGLGIFLSRITVVSSNLLIGLILLPKSLKNRRISRFAMTPNLYAYSLWTLLESLKDRNINVFNHINFWISLLSYYLVCRNFNYFACYYNHQCCWFKWRGAWSVENLKRQIHRYNMKS